MQIDIQVSNKQLFGLVIVSVLVAAIGYVQSYGSGSPTIIGHTWDEIDNIPSGFADGIDDNTDTFAGFSCSEGQLLKISGGVWRCVDDPALLPDCSSGEHLKWNGYAWECTSDVVTVSYADSNYKDPPGEWTCTVRSASRSSWGGVTAYCVGNEKVITGGCRLEQCSGECLTGWPVQHGWRCYTRVGDPLYAYAYCCV